MEGLPLYILRIATEVEWNSEKDCFQTFCRETAKFYAIPEKIYKDPDEEVCLVNFLRSLDIFKNYAKNIFIDLRVIYLNLNTVQYAIS